MKIARTMTSGVFWLPIIVSYFQYRGLSLDMSYMLLSIYSFCIVILEYPTGVIGDYFSHKISLRIGYFLVALAFVLMGLNGGMLLYVISLFVGATGVSLVSGSDDAVLISVSDKYESDYREIRSFSIVFSIVATVLGGVLYKIYPPLPIFFTALSFLISFVSVMFIRKKTEMEEFEGNIFDKAFSSLDFVKKKNFVRYLIIYASLVAAFFSSSKWFYNPIFESIGVDESLLGVGISFLMLLSALGTRFSKKYSFYYWRYSLVFLGLLISLGLGIGNAIVVLPMIGLFLFRGIAETQLEIRLNKKIPDSMRASIVSLKNLLMRLLSAIYLGVAGVGVESLGLGNFFVITALVLLALFAGNFFLMKKFKN